MNIWKKIIRLFNLNKSLCKVNSYFYVEIDYTILYYINIEVGVVNYGFEINGILGIE